MNFWSFIDDILARPVSLRASSGRRGSRAELFAVVAWALLVTSAPPRLSAGQSECRVNEHRGGYPPGCVCDDGFRPEGRGRDRICVAIPPPSEPAPASPPGCAPGQQLVDGHCCADGQIWANGACRVWCPDELREENGRCVRRCPEGYAWQGDRCVPLRPVAAPYVRPVTYEPSIARPQYYYNALPARPGLMHGFTLGLSGGGIIFTRAVTADPSQVGLWGSLRAGYSLGDSPQVGLFGEAALFNQLHNRNDSTAAVDPPASAPPTTLTGSMFAGGLHVRLGELNENADAKSWRLFVQLEASAGWISYSTDLGSGPCAGAGATLYFGPRNSWTAAGIRLAWIHDISNGLDSIVVTGDGHFDLTRRW